MNEGLIAIGQLFPAFGAGKMDASFEYWTRSREVESWGTNAGAEVLPFQSWRHFKEAFTPEIVARAVAGAVIPVRRLLDPFGGSGTTGITSQFLGVHPILVEVNPFLADLIQAKLSRYKIDLLVRDLAYVAGASARSRKTAKQVFGDLPASFIEPGVSGRWLFDRAIADKLARLRLSIEAVPNPANRRLFKVLLGNVLIDSSNALINGKGRRYRRNWQERPRRPEDVDARFFDAARTAISDIHRFSNRKSRDFDLLRGDCRKKVDQIKSVDLAVFSPPYPNSFDYTDVYNIELWMLGYLKNFQDNRRLRLATLSSHVQIHRNFDEPPNGSQKLRTAISSLKRNRDDLWSSRIPEMVGSYFAEMFQILEVIHKKLKDQGEAWIVIGDSRYSGVQIKAAEILAELSHGNGWKVRSIEPFREMRVSSQQGGQHGLDETLLVLRKTSSNRN